MNRFNCYCVKQCFCNKANGAFRCVCCFSTCSSLKGIYGSVYACCCRAVLPCSDLCVQSTDVEQHASLLKGQRALTRRDACQRVVPERWRDVKLQFQTMIDLLIDTDSQMHAVFKCWWKCVSRSNQATLLFVHNYDKIKVFILYQ